MRPTPARDRPGDAGPPALRSCRGSGRAVAGRGRRAVRRRRFRGDRQQHGTDDLRMVARDRVQEAPELEERPRFERRPPLVEVLEDVVDRYVQHLRHRKQALGGLMRLAPVSYV